MHLGPATCVFRLLHEAKKPLGTNLTEKSAEIPAIVLDGRRGRLKGLRVFPAITDAFHMDLPTKLNWLFSAISQTAGLRAEVSDFASL